MAKAGVCIEYMTLCEEQFQEFQQRVCAVVVLSYDTPGFRL